MMLPDDSDLDDGCRVAVSRGKVYGVLRRHAFSKKVLQYNL